MSSVSGQPAKSTSGCTCKICETKLTCPHCTPFENEIKQLQTFCLLVAVVAILLVSHESLFGLCSCISPQDCYATGRGLKVAEIGERSTAILYTVGQDGKGYIRNMDTITCEVIHDLLGERSDCGVNKITGNQYKISYLPTSRGRHQLHIKVEGEHIKGSPFNVTVIKKLGTPINIINWLNKPYGVVVNQKGEVIVAENGGHCISIFSPTGEIHDIVLGSFDSKASGQGQLSHPRGITVDDKDNILVADEGNHRIQIFSSDYTFIASAGSKGSSHLQFMNPSDVVISPTTKNVVIAEHLNHRVQILNPDLTFNSSIGKWGSGNGQFNHPNSVAFDSAGNMYVTDFGNHRIQVFNPKRKYLRKFGKLGNGEGELNSPAGICIGSDDTVYVVERDNHCVSLFTCEGTFLTSFGSEGDGPGQFSSPQEITVDKDGLIYVTDAGNNRVQIFEA